MSSKTKAMLSAGALTGIPEICKDWDTLRVLIGGKNANGIKFPKAILTCDEGFVTYYHFAKQKDWAKENGKWHGDVWCSNEWEERLCKNSNGMSSQDYLSKSLIDKRVFCPTQHFQMHFLPTYARPYVLIDKSVDDVNTVLNSNPGTFKEIQFTDEKTIADLYINAWKYSYDIEKGYFVRLDDNKANFNALHWYMLRDCIRYGGTADDRIADLSRIIIYLLSKISLGDSEEKEIIDELVSYIDTKSIVKLLKKELFLTKFINDVRKAPLDYLISKRDINVASYSAKCEWE